MRGAVPGEEREFDFTFPEELEDKERAGKKAHASLKVERVQRRIVPEEDDAFAKSIGFESVEALRLISAGSSRRRRSEQADDYVERDLLAAVVKRSTVNFPQSMVDQEVAHRMDTLTEGPGAARHPDGRLPGPPEEEPRRAGDRLCRGGTAGDHEFVGAHRDRSRQ